MYKLNIHVPTVIALLTVNVLVLSASKYCIWDFLLWFILKIANDDIQTYDLLLVLLQRLKTPCFIFELQVWLLALYQT